MNKAKTKKKEYLPFNYTDEIVFTPFAFPTKQAALDYIKRFLESVRSHQDYWLTASGHRIPVGELTVGAMEVERIK